MNFITLAAGKTVVPEERPGQPRRWSRRRITRRLRVAIGQIRGSVSSDFPEAAGRDTSGMPIGEGFRQGLCAKGLVALLLFVPPGTALGDPPPPAKAAVPAGATGLPPYVVRVLRQGTEIELSGTILYGIAENLHRALNANPAVKVLHLNSPGGEMSEARSMVAMVRQRGLTTVADTFCMSACTLVFLAGRERYLAPGAKLGFHRPMALDMSPDETNAIEQGNRDFMLSLGIPAAFVDRVYSTPSSSIWIPSAAELKTANVITGVTARFPITLARYDTDYTITSEFTVRSLELIRRADPEGYKGLHQRLFEAMRSGRSDAEIWQILDAELSRQLRRFLSHASDKLVVEYFQVLAGSLAEMSAQSADDCFFAMHPQKAPEDFKFSHYIARATSQRIIDVTLRILSDGIERRAPIPTEGEIAAAALTFLEQMRSAYPGNLDALSRTDSPDADHAAICKAQIDMVTTALALPEGQRGPLLRFIFADWVDEPVIAGGADSQPLKLLNVHPSK
jgi:hypothetical protein